MSLTKTNPITAHTSPLDPFIPSPLHPLGTVILTAVTAAGISEHTRRSYQTSLGQFFTYLSEVLNIDPPLAEPEPDGRRILWAFRGNADILRHVTPTLLDGFRTWLQATGTGINTQETRLSAIVTFLSVCLGKPGGLERPLRQDFGEPSA